MQNNEKIYRIECTKEEYEFIKGLMNELDDKFSKMSSEEIQEFLKTICPEQNLNFEKEVKGKVYKVNTYFNENSEYTILQSLFEIFKE